MLGPKSHTAVWDGSDATAITCAFAQISKVAQPDKRQRITNYDAFRDHVFKLGRYQVFVEGRRACFLVPEILGIDKVIRDFVAPSRGN
jgi:hypothetical protein